MCTSKRGDWVEPSPQCRVLCKIFKKKNCTVWTQQLDKTENHWRSCSLLDQEIHRQLLANVHLFSDSVLGFGGECQTRPRTGELWEKERIAYFFSSPECRQIHNTAREPGVFEWPIYPGHTTAQLLDEVHKMLNIDKTHPINFNGSSSCRCTMTLAGDQKRHEEVCNRNVSVPANAMPNYFRKYDGLESNHETKKNGTGLTSLSHTLKEMEQHCRRCDEDICRKWTPLEPIMVFEKAGGAKDLLCITMRIRRQQNYCRKKVFVVNQQQDTSV